MFAYLLLAQSVLVPIARAKAAELAGHDAALSIICSSNLSVQGEDGAPSDKKQVHDFGCCTLAARIMLDVPALLPVLFAPVVEPVLVAHRIAFALPQGRAPPAITSTPSQSRAPPLAG